jgi:hypothetical protein
LVIAAALGINSRETGKTTEYAIVDPYPRSVIENSLPELSQLIRQRVELLDVSFFDQLRDKDVLFVDSGHTVRIGGDVNYLVLDVLPRLAGGVLVTSTTFPYPMNTRRYMLPIHSFVSFGQKATFFKPSYLSIGSLRSYWRWGT